MKLKSISIQEWFGKEGQGFRWNLERDLNILKGPNRCGKTTLLRDIQDLIFPVTCNATKEPLWKSALTKVMAKVELVDKHSADDCYVYWLSRDTYPDVYNFRGYNHTKDNFITFWDPEAMLEIIDAGELCEDNIMGQFAELKEGEQKKILDGINYIIFDDKGTKIQQIEEIIDEGKLPSIRFRFTNGEPLYVEDLSFGYKMLIAMMSYMPMEKDSVFMIDNPELGLCDAWCKRLVLGLQRINPDCQLIITTGSDNIGFGNSMYVRNIKDLFINVGGK